MPKLRTILAEPKYPAFVAKYRHNWRAFAVEACGELPTWQQDNVLSEVQAEGSRVSVASGHGTGKSALSAIMILSFMICYPRARVILTANKVQQVKIGVFKYLKHYWPRIEKRYPWLSKYFVLTMEQFYSVGFQGQWEVVIKGYRMGNEEALAGEHALHLLYIVDEASGLSDKAFSVIEGALTQEDNRLLLLSQPTRSVGTFYDSHHERKRAAPGERGFASIMLNSEESPLVTTDYIEDWLKKSGGRDSPEYCIRVRGIFTDHAEGFLIGRVMTENGFKAKFEHEEGYGYVALCDVAGGEGRDSSVINICRVSGLGDNRKVESLLVKEMPLGVNGSDFAKHIKAMVNGYQNITVAIDSDGYGLITAQEAERMGLNVVRIRWGFPPHSKDHKIRFSKKKDYACVMVHDALRDGRLKLYSDSHVHGKTVKQFTKIPYTFDEKGRWLMDSKQKLAAAGIKSPDIFDTYAFAWLVDYIPAGEAVVDAHDDDYENWAGELLGLDADPIEQLLNES